MTLFGNCNENPEFAFPFSLTGGRGFPCPRRAAGMFIARRLCLLVMSPAGSVLRGSHSTSHCVIPWYCPQLDFCAERFLNPPVLVVQRNLPGGFLAKGLSMRLIGCTRLLRASFFFCEEGGRLHTAPRSTLAARAWRDLAARAWRGPPFPSAKGGAITHVTWISRKLHQTAASSRKCIKIRDFQRKLYQNP